ncbi:MAG: 2Fe-2S iron-sulfur cluster binding domain-containing protein [Betaproteobacteria bacterium]|nr:2Fe-2S iron-sulfur cluster binding domain-containing protein [Betaproteobacteria bacterium]
MPPSLEIASPSEVFINYTRLPQRIPDPVWMLLRLVVLGLTFAEIGLLFTHPELGLRLFWGVVVPCLPALFAIAPGLWRQLCPMAFVNQLPRILGFGRALTLPSRLRFWSYAIAIGVLVSMISIRSLVLNQTGWAVGVMCAISIVLAFIGGVFYKGRSGWCGTFCPLAPVQRSHGQSPLIVVRNGYCPTCVGCQKNCFDFNPRAAIFGDLGDNDPRHSMQRMIFMSSLPGLIWGYYNVAGVLELGFGRYLLALAGSTFVSAGLFFTLRSLLNLSAYRLATAFGLAALLIYYYFAGPILVNSVSELAVVVPPGWLVESSRFIALPIAAAVLWGAVRAELAFHALDSAESQVRVDPIKVHAARARDMAGIQITERGSGKTFSAKSDQTLLEAMEAAGVPIDFGCRSGLCGADPVGIVDGHDQLDAPGPEELATLRRLGLEGRARLACSCRATGAVTIDRDPRSVPAVVPAQPEAPKPDRAAAAGISRVLIIGNGVAGITAAETLRRESASVQITVVADEPHHFYNRMSIGRVIYNQTSMDGMHLVPDSWYKENRITVWLNTVAVAIDREARTVRLGTGESLEYDRLVLATGAKAAPPGPGFLAHDNAFVLRSAADAQAIRAAIQRIGAKKAIVIGGGVLGIEAAEAMTHLGLRVTILQRSKRLMDRQLDAEGAQLLTTYLGHQGVDTLTECRVAGFEGDELLRGVRLEDGRLLEADLFLACAGIAPNSGLAREAGLEVGRGVKVDASMRTSDPMIFAAGDVAEAGKGLAGLWPVAVDQARAAVEAMLGSEASAAQPRIVLQLKSEGIDLRSFGATDPVADGCEVLTSAGGGILWWRLVLHAGTVLGAVFVGPPGSSKELTRLLQSGADFTEALPALRQGELTLTKAQPPQK